MCGIVGIVSSEPVNQQVYDSLLLLQHRGQDSTGIATAEGRTFHSVKAKGQVREAFPSLTFTHHDEWLGHRPAPSDTSLRPADRLSDVRSATSVLTSPNA